MTRQKTTSVTRRLAIAALLATLAATVSWTAASASDRVGGTGVPIVGLNDRGRVPGRYLVQLREGFRTGTDAGIVSRRHGGALRGLYREVGSFLFGGSAGDAAELAQDTRVVRIEADRKVELTGTDHVIDKNTDAIRRLRVRYTSDTSNCLTVPTTTCIGITGAGVRMAIIDTGVDQDHPEFSYTNGAPSSTRIANDRAKCDGSAVLTTTTTGANIADDFNGHGTRNAGNAAAGGFKIYGVAPAAIIVPVKVALKVSAITCGINYLTALNNDVTSTNDVHVVSLSLVWGDGGTPDACASTAVSGQAICNLYNSLDEKVFITAAAGNSNKNVSSVAPGKWNQTNAVSAECERSPFGHPGNPDGLATFTNYGSQVDFASPGCNVFSSEDGAPGAANYRTSSGTSRSSPHLAGMATLLIQAKQPTTITAAEIKSAMQVGGMCPDNTFNTDGGNCNAGQGQWPRISYKTLNIADTPDKDGIAEPLPIAYNSVCAVSGLC